MLDLDSVSLLLLWTAIALYALAFVAYAFDLARRSDVKVAAAVPAAAVVGAGPTAPAAPAVSADLSAGEQVARPRYVMARIGTALTALGLLFHLGATVLRGVAAERVPWANLYEFAMTGTLLIVLVYLAVLIRLDVGYLGTFITGLVVVLLGGAAMSFYVVVVPLADPLKSVWLVIHVFVASLSTAFFALACALSVLQLLQTRRVQRQRERASFLTTLPAADQLEGMAFRFAVVGFILWTFTLIAGSIWAQDAWSRYWGFDVKETWTFIIWVLYAGYLHARSTRGWRGTPSAWLSIAGFSAVIFNFAIVNVFFKGLHAYSGLT